ncbi:MAG: hypothetical protein IPO92_11180 [Saprospiraceae bacterium]|nr:hypothetical protein [Saprospiraceae bacterium]
MPIKKSPVSIRKALLKNGNFEDDRKGETANFKNSNSTFKGTILKPVLPKNGSLDSSKIYLTTGSLTMPDGYSGNMKWIRFEYFSSDTLFLNELFDSACIHLKETSMEQKPTGHLALNNQAIGKGINFVYTNNSKRYISISASRVRYASGKRSLKINYSASDD